jgi:hypothetical protein
VTEYQTQSLPAPERAKRPHDDEEFDPAKRMRLTPRRCRDVRRERLGERRQEREVMREMPGVDSRLVKPFLTVGLVIGVIERQLSWKVNDCRLMILRESGARYCSPPCGHLPGLRSREAFISRAITSTTQSSRRGSVRDREALEQAECASPER